MEESARPYVLVCERIWLYRTLTAVAGFFGAFTYLLRGNVFCNAQTGNVVLMGMALGSGQWWHALYYLIPISAYIGGAFLSEILPTPVKRHLPMRWETMLIAIEIAAVLFLGLLPESAPVPDFPGDDQLHRLHAIQYLPPVRGGVHGYHVRHQPHPSDRRRAGP